MRVVDDSLAPVTWARAVGLAVLVAAVAGPYLTKPIHMDGPVTVAMARQVLADPLDPLGYAINWDGRVHRGYELNNPPFTGYLMAIGVALAGVSELSLHASETVLVALAAVAIFGLARRFTRHPWTAAALVLASPAFIPSQNVMFDVTLLALWTAALWAWVEGVERDRAALAWLGALVAGLAILTKYSGVALVPLLALYALLRRRYRALWALLLIGAIIAGWAAHNVASYGAAHVFSRPTPGIQLELVASRGLAGLKALGGMTLVGLFCPAVILGVQRPSLRALWGLLAVGAAAVAVWATLARLDGHAAPQLRTEDMHGYATTLLVTLSVMVVLGTLAVIAALVGSLRERYEPHRAGTELFLWAWLVGVFGFNVLFSPFMAIRNLLPALAPLVILVLRGWEAVGVQRAWRFALPATVALTAALGYAVGEGDRGAARAYRREAQALARRYARPGRTIWSVGYWGWQWYAAEAGFRDLHSGNVGEARPGDLVIMPTGVHQESSHARLPLATVERYRVPLGDWPVRTVSNFYRVGFYRSELDDVPYVFARFDALPIVVARVLEAGP